MTDAPALPTLETPRLRLRPLSGDDAEGLHTCYGDAESMRFWDFPPSRDVAETARRIRQSLGVSTTWHACWSLLSRADGRYVGMVNYHHREPWNCRLEVGYILAPPFRRQGLMSEAMRAFLRYCFDGLDTHRVEATIEPENAESIRLAERLGFVCETGLLRDRMRVAGVYRSVRLHGLLEPDWRGADG